MQQALQSLGSMVHWSASQNALLTSLVIILALTLLRWVLLFVVRRRTPDVRLRYHWRKITAYVAVAFGVFLVGRVWFEGLTSVATFLGLVGAGLAVALKDPVSNFAAWLFILWRRPFVVGDRIQLGQHAGDVVDQRVFQFTILEIGNWVGADQSTGRIIHIPNGQVFSEPLANYTRGFPYIWNEIPVMVTFESDWEAAKEILLGIARAQSDHLTADAERRVLAASRRFMIFYSTLEPTVYTSVADSGVVLTVRYLCEARRRRGTSQAMWEEILRAFGAREDIDFAYPTTRFYDNVTEGKREARAAPDEGMGVAGEPPGGQGR